MPSHIILWPIFVYVGASLFIPRLRPWLGRPARTLGIVLSSVLAFLMVLFLVQQMGESSAEWTLSTWRALAGVGRGIQFQVDTLGSAFLLLVGLSGMGVLVGSLDEPEQGTTEDYQAGILALLGALAMLGVSANMLTFLLAEFLLEAALIFAVGLAGQPRWFLVTVMHTLISQGLMLGATLLLWKETGATALTGASDQVVFLLVLAAVARMAPLPFSLFPIAFETLPQRVLAVLPLTTLGVGGLLLGRIAQHVPLEGLPSLEGMASLGALGVALGGWVAWRREEPAVRLMMLGAVQAAWSLWAFAWGLPQAAILTAWFGAVALAALAVHGGRLDFRHGTQLAGLVAALMLVGAPGSALWSTVTTVSGQAWARGNLWLLTMAAVGMMGTMVALIHWLLPGKSEPIQRSRWIGVSLLAVLSVPLLGGLWGIRVPELPTAPLLPAPLPAYLVVLVFGWAGGLWLWRDRDLLRPLHPGLDLAALTFSFVWLWRFVGRLGWLLLSGLRGMMLVLEGENYGWLLLFLFVTMIFLLQR